MIRKKGKEKKMDGKRNKFNDVKKKKENRDSSEEKERKR